MGLSFRSKRLTKSSEDRSLLFYGLVQERSTTQQDNTRYMRGGPEDIVKHVIML